MADNIENTYTESPSFVYDGKQYDSKVIANYLEKNASKWIAHSGFSGNLEVASSINELISRIQDGDIDSMDESGVVHSNSYFTNNGGYKHLFNFNNEKGIIRTGKKLDSNGVAALFLKEAMSAVDSKSNSNTTTKVQPFSNEFLSKAWVNKYFGGNSPTPTNIISSWYNLDSKNSEGKRGIQNRLMEFSKFLNQYANSSDLLKYDYKDSAYGNAQVYRDRLKAAAVAAQQAAADGSEQSFNNFLSLYSQAGGKDADILFSRTDNVGVEQDIQQGTISDPIADARKQKIEELRLMGYNENEVAQRIAEWEANLKKDQQKLRLQYDEDRDWNTYLTGFTPGTDYHYRFVHYNTDSANDENFWGGRYGHGLGDDQNVQSFFKKHANTIKQLEKDMIKGKPLSHEILSDGITKAEAMAAYIAYDSSNPNSADDYITSDDGTLIIKATIQPDGSAYKYNPKTKTLSRMYINPAHPNGALYKYFKEQWLKNRYTNLKEGGVIKAFGGTSVDDLWKTRETEQKKEVADAADKAGKTVDQYRAGNRHIVQDGKDLFDAFEDQDWFRLGAMGADIVGLVASLTGYGDVINAGTNVVSIGANVAANVLDESMTTSDKWINGATQVGLSAIGLIPGLESLKIIKNASSVAKPVLKTIKGLMTVYGAVDSLQTWGNVWQKIEKGENLTVNDWRDVGRSITFLTNVGKNGIQSAKGKAALKKAGLTKKNNKVEPKTTSSKDLEQTEGWKDKNWFEKLKARVSNWQNNTRAKQIASAKNLFSEDQYKISDPTAYNQFLAKYGLNGQKATATGWDRFFYGTGKYSDIGRIHSRWDILPTPIGLLPYYSQEEINKFNRNSAEKNLIESLKNITKAYKDSKNVQNSALNINTPVTIPKGNRNLDLSESRIIIGDNKHHILTKSGKALEDDFQLKFPDAKEINPNLLTRSPNTYKKALFSPSAGMAFAYDNGGKLEILKAFKEGGILKFQNPAGSLPETFFDYINDWKKGAIFDYNTRYRNDVNKSDNKLTHIKREHYGTDNIASGNDKYDPVYGGNIAEQNDYNKWFYKQLLTNKDLAKQWAWDYLNGHNEITTHGQNWFGKTSDGKYDINQFNYNNFIKSENLWNDRINGEGHDVYGSYVYYIKDSNGNKQYVRLKTGQIPEGWKSHSKTLMNGQDIVHEILLTPEGEQENSNPNNNIPTKNPSSEKDPNDISNDTEEVEGEGGLTEGGSYTNPYSNIVKQSLSKVNRYFDKIDPYSILRLTGALAHNNRVNRLNHQKGVSLVSHTPKHLNIEEPRSKVDSEMADAAKIDAAAKRTASGLTDAGLAAATMLEGASRSDDSRQKINNYRNDYVQRRIDAQTNQEFANVDMRDADRNENAMRFTQFRNFLIDGDMAKLYADWDKAWNPWLMEQSYNRKTKLADDKAAAIYAAELNADTQRKNYLGDLPSRLAAATYGSKEYNNLREELTKRINEYNAGPGFDAMMDILRAKGIDTSKIQRPKKQNSINFEGVDKVTSNKATYSKKGGILNYMKYLKSGGKTSKDDGPVKTRSKDLDRFQKAVKQAADSSDKQLARLAAATLLELKRSMGK